MEKIKYWGYLHTSGTIHVKRYWDERDTQEAHQSPFCAKVVGPFEADDRESAIEYIKEQLKNS